MTERAIVHRGALTPRWPTRSANVLASMTMALFVVSRTTGAGWMVVVLSANAGILLIGAIVPLLSLRRVQIDVRAPRDATAGEPLPIRIVTPGRHQPFRLRLCEPETGWVHVEPPADGAVEIPFVRRGVLPRLEVEVASAAPLGLVWWHRRMTVDLARPVEIGPRRVHEPWSSLLGGAAGTAGQPRSLHGGDMARGVRDYLPGDPARLVHWPATARRGHLVVKELEDPEVARLFVVAELGWLPDDADEVAARALGLCTSALAAGVPVTLATVEAAGPRVADVVSRIDASRRLARAVAGTPSFEAPRGTTLVRLGPP